MPKPVTYPLLDASLMAGLRAGMPTSLGTAELRELGVDVLARSVFSARATNAIFVSKLKELVELLANGELGEGQVRTALVETLGALRYTPEGGFPDAVPGAVPPAVRGSLQDLSSFKRLDLMVKTQLALMQGRGDQYRGHTPDRLAAYPAWELVRVGEVMTAREWNVRWQIAGGKPVAAGYSENAFRILGARTGMIALKGDPVWGELGSYQNFPDALGVDHSPWYFNSEMGWHEVSAERVQAEGITGPNGETPAQWFASKPIVMAGKIPLPTAQVSLAGVDPQLVTDFEESTHATRRPGTPATYDFSDLLAREIANRDAARKGGGQ